MSKRPKAMRPPGAEKPSKRNVLMGYLCRDSVSDNFHRCMFDLINWDMGHEQRLLNWVKVRSGPMSIVESRNKLCEQVMLNPEVEWLFMVDSDMGFEQDTLDHLLAVADPEKRPVVGGLCFANRELGDDGMGGMITHPAPTILHWTEQASVTGKSRFLGVEHYPVNVLIPCGATGAACLLIHRSAVTRVWSEFGGRNIRGEMTGWFERTNDCDGLLQGEDISFCDRLRQLEIPLHVHTGIRTTHQKTIWLAEPDFWRSRLAPPATETVEVIVPVLHRPKNVRPLLESLRATTGLARAWFVVEPGDTEEIDEVVKYGGNVIVEAGTYSHKVNTAYQQLSAKQVSSWMLIVGDDVVFRPGWLDQALDIARRYGAKVVGTNDLMNDAVIRGEHATHPLISMDYIRDVGASWDGPGVVCHEGYRHNYVDNEMAMAARLRGVFQAALGSIVEHRHHLNKRAELDDVYRLGTESIERDRLLFEGRARRALTEQSRDPQNGNRPLRVVGLDQEEPAPAEATA